MHHGPISFSFDIVNCKYSTLLTISHFVLERIHSLLSKFFIFRKLYGRTDFALTREVTDESTTDLNNA